MRGLRPRQQCDEQARAQLREVGVQVVRAHVQLQVAVPPQLPPAAAASAAPRRCAAATRDGRGRHCDGGGGGGAGALGARWGGGRAMPVGLGPGGGTMSWLLLLGHLRMFRYTMLFGGAPLPRLLLPPERHGCGQVRYAQTATGRRCRVAPRECVWPWIAMAGETFSYLRNLGFVIFGLGFRV